MTDSSINEGASCCSAIMGVVDQAAIGPLYLQLLTLGSLMVLGHCSGMCGPLILSFRFGHDQEKRPALCATKQLLSYQFGKAIIYMIAGISAAALGSSLLAVRDWAAYLCIVVAAIILVQAISWWAPFKLKLMPASVNTRIQKLIQRLQRGSSAQRKLHPLRGSFFLGMSMSLLPCMLPFWVLGLAASSASVVHGALLMGLLVVLNTPILLLFALAPHVIKRWREWTPSYMAPAALCCSATWMLLIGLASLQYIDHLSFKIGPTHLVFW